MSLRILFAIHGPANVRTAVYHTALRRAEFLRARGHAVEIITPADLPLGSWFRLHPLVLSPGLAARGLDSYDVVIFHSHLAWAHQLWSWFRRSRPATVVAFHGLEPLYHAALGEELARTNERVSWQFHLLHRVVVPRLLTIASRRADRVFCLNSLERAFVIAHGWAEPARVVVLPNGVERDLFVERRAYACHGRRILFIGQWLRAKGVRYLARAFEVLASTYPDAQLTCVGTGATDAVLADFVPGVRARVRVVAGVDRSELREALAQADLFMFPSLSEGFSGALLEAMAAALPVIATAVGGAVDLLRHGDNAWVVPAADSAALVAAAARLMDDSAGRRQLGGAAQATARAYEWDAVNERFAIELETLAGAAR